MITSTGMQLRENKKTVGNQPENLTFNKTFDGKVYFVSDAHLGIPDKQSSLEREKLLVDWLEEIRKDAFAVFFMGDIFDFWFEYKNVVPKGYIRLLGKIAEISDQGIPVFYFTGNHDMWLYDYFPQELNMRIFRETIQMELNGKKFFIGHGDGLGPKDFGYKFLKMIFSNSLSQWLFARLHPNFGIWLAHFFSKRSRLANGETEEIFRGEDKEYLILFAREILKTESFDYFVFGHRHIPMDIRLTSQSRYVNLGDWFKSYSYAVFDGNELSLNYYQKKETAL